MPTMRRSSIICAVSRRRDKLSGCVRKRGSDVSGDGGCCYRVNDGSRLLLLGGAGSKEAEVSFTTTSLCPTGC